MATNGNNGNMNTGNPGGQIDFRGTPNVSQGLGGYTQGYIARSNFSNEFWKQGGYLSESINELKQMKDTYEEMSKVVTNMTKTEQNAKRKIMLEYKKQLQYLENMQKIGFATNEDAIDAVNETNKLLVKGQGKYIELLQKVKEEYKDIQAISESTIDNAINKQNELNKKYKEQKVIFNDVNKILNNAPKDWSSALVKNLKSVKDDLMGFANMFNLQAIANSSLQQSARNKAEIMTNMSTQFGFTSSSQFDSFKNSLNNTLKSMNSDMGAIFNSSDMKTYMANLSTYGITNTKMAQEQMRNSIIASKYLGASVETQTAIFKYMKLTNNNEAMSNYNKTIVGILKSDLGISKQQLDQLTQMATADQDALMASGMSAETYEKYLKQYDTAGAVLTSMYGQDVSKSIMGSVSELARSSYLDAETLISKYGPNAVQAMEVLKNTGDVMKAVQMLTGSASGWGQGAGSNINNSTYQAVLGANNSSALVGYNYLSKDLNKFTDKANDILDGVITTEDLEGFVKETTQLTAVDKIQNMLDVFINGIPWKWTMGLANAALVAYLAAKPFEMYSYIKNMNLTSLLTSKLGEGGPIEGGASKLLGGGTVVGLTATTIAAMALGIAAASKSVYGSGKNETSAKNAVWTSQERDDAGGLASWWHDFKSDAAAVGGTIHKGIAGQLFGSKKAEAQGTWTQIMSLMQDFRSEEDAMLYRLAALMLFDKGNILQYIDVDENHGAIVSKYNNLSQTEKDIVRSYAQQIQADKLGYVRDYDRNVISVNSIDWANYHKAGKNYIPRDNYKALLHKGEMVLNAREADFYRQMFPNGGESDNVPRPSGRIISGLPWTMTAGYPSYPSGSQHRGVDFGIPVGTPVGAAFSGDVIGADSSVNYNTYGSGIRSFGTYVLVKGDNGRYYRYGHLSKLGVLVGQRVNAGDTIGLSGNTGYSTGPHLHFQVQTGTANNTDISPYSYITSGLFQAKGDINIPSFDNKGTLGTEEGVVKLRSRKFIPTAFTSATNGQGGGEDMNRAVDNGINKIINYLDSVREEQAEQRKLINAFSKSRSTELTF